MGTNQRNAATSNKGARRKTGVETEDRNVWEKEVISDEKGRINITREVTRQNPMKKERGDIGRNAGVK